MSSPLRKWLIAGAIAMFAVSLAGALRAPPENPGAPKVTTISTR